MKISRAFRNAGRAYFGHFASSMGFLLVELCLTLICLAPLLFLFEKELKWGALLVLPLWVLILLPVRMNAAAAMREALRGGSLFTRTLGDFSGYGSKLICGFKRLLFLLLWSLPALFMAWQIWEHITGEMDGFTLMRMIRSDFGGGELFRGVLVIAGIVLVTLLLVLLGCAFHSGARHAWAQGRPELIRGHHGKLIGTWFCALLSVLPLLAAIILIAIRYAPVLGDLNGLFMGTADLPSTRGSLIILGAGALLTIPLLPLRSLITAAYVQGLEEKAGNSWS